MIGVVIAQWTWLVHKSICSPYLENLWVLTILPSYNLLIKLQYDDKCIVDTVLVVTVLYNNIFSMIRTSTQSSIKQFNCVVGNNTKSSNLEYCQRVTNFSGIFAKLWQCLRFMYVSVEHGNKKHGNNMVE